LFGLVLGDNGVVIYANGRGTLLAIEPNVTAIRFDPPLAFGTWQRMFVRIDNVPASADAGPDGLVQVFVEAALVASAPLPPRFRTPLPSVQMSVGLHAAGPVKAFRANFDNVFARWE